MNVFRGVPAVHTILEHPAVAPYELLVGRAALRDAIGAELDRVRADRDAAPLEMIVERVVERVERQASAELRGVINATGTLLHTNLGRAPIAESAFTFAWSVSHGYSNLEFDLTAGERGSRYDRATAILCELTGAQDAIVVNNCAAAILLILDTFARGAEVVIARNQLIEVGGGFRLPDVLARSGAKLVEAGATNKVYVADYERALTPRTALLFRSHRSNFAIEGFIADVGGAELASLGKRAGVPAVEDLGTGALVDVSRYGLPRERTVQEAVADGLSLVAFSGDKLLGGPQAGIVVGERWAIARLRSNPLVRALRVDKVTLALLAETLRLYRDAETLDSIPLLQMLGSSLETLRERAERIASTLANAKVVQCDGFVGGGSLPQARIASIAVSVATPYAAELAERLRAWRVPIVARIEDDNVILDMRSVFPDQDREIISAFIDLLS
ncbi:MAG: L-seryl-tRNA(Sec) selenium transferase [Candidatus Eremiobacteraeota bacterium]|nr:L-seryl-tRNA(Sec) selenium transferase [Candidatus Eremiobacteraeota bacterium]